MNVCALFDFNLCGTENTAVSSCGKQWLVTAVCQPLVVTCRTVELSLSQSQNILMELLH